MKTAEYAKDAEDFKICVAGMPATLCAVQKTQHPLRLLFGFDEASAHRNNAMP